MVICETSSETVKTDGVLYSSPETIRKLGVQLMIRSAEFNTDMVCDCPNEYKTKDEIEAVFTDINQQALDMLEDHIADLRRNMESFLRNVKFRARVTRIDYDKTLGDMRDITVDIDVE